MITLGSPACDAGTSPWGSIERLQALRNLLCIAGGEPLLLEVLQPAMQDWLNMAASGAAHGDHLQRYHILGTFVLAIFWTHMLAYPRSRP